MKCKYCNSEWQSKVKVKVCPFCGESMTESLVFSDIEQTLRYILDTYGEQVNRNPNSIVSYLGDLAPGLTNERRLLKMCMDAGIIAELLSITDQAERSLAVKRAVTILSNTYFLDAKWAETAVRWLTVSMGWTNSAGGAQTAEETQPEVVPASQQKNPNATARRSGVGVELKPTTKESAQVERIKKRREELKQYAGRIVCDDNHILALCSDGRVIAYGENDEGQCNVEDWRDVTAIACDYGVSIGLAKDRTVLCTDTDTDLLYEWQNIVQISVGLNLMGLCSDGAVRCDCCDDVDEDEECPYSCAQRKRVSRWRNVTAVACAGDTNYGLLADGTVVACGDNEYGQCDVDDWKDIVSIATRRSTVYGIRRDGRVYARGENDCGQCDVDSWRDIIDIAPGYDNVFGLKSDGSVVYTGEKNARFESVYTWTDVVSVAHSFFSVAGLKSDGTVVVCGGRYGSRYNTSGWRDIVAIVCGDDYVVGLQADGTVVFTGEAENGEDKIAGQNLFR